MTERIPGQTARAVGGFLRRDLWKWVAAYILLLGLMALLGRWTPEFLTGRTLWHFLVSRMVVAFVMLGVLASFIRLVPAALLLSSMLLIVGTISAIKRASTGEPFQISDLFLTGQTPALLGYVAWYHWLAALSIVPALYLAARNLRLRLWSLPLALFCAGLLSTYRIEAVVDWIHDNSYWIGVENLTFNQAESERMNGLATHLYFSTAGLRIKSYSDAEVEAAMSVLAMKDVPAARQTPAPDIFVVLGEAWWRDPTDPQSPLDTLTAKGFAEGKMVSPVYGGTTPNAEFEVLTAIPARSFMSGIIPFQHYVRYFSDQAKSMPRLLSTIGYTARAYHNFDRRFWLRDQVYPRFNFATFDSMDSMKLEKQGNGWPKDDGLYAKVMERLDAEASQFHFIVTVQTHGPFAGDKVRDMIDGKEHPGIADYHDRLAGAVASFAAFRDTLDRRGKPYVLFVFGDHLPGLRLHQWKMGWTSEQDPRLHEVPFLVASNSEDAAALRDRLDTRPLFCTAPVMLDWLRLGLDDRYLRHMAQVCDEGKALGYVPPEPVIQNQIFNAAAP